jgi:hypothetical protein
MDDSWELYYWTRIKEDGKNHMIGRGEFVRLMFEAAGVNYVEKGNPDASVVFQFVMGGTKSIFTAPILTSARKSGLSCTCSTID